MANTSCTCRRNVTPASFEGEGGTPRRMALRQFEIPMAGVQDREGGYSFCGARVCVYVGC